LISERRTKKVCGPEPLIWGDGTDVESELKGLNGKEKRKGNWTPKEGLDAATWGKPGWRNNEIEGTRSV